MTKTVRDYSKLALDIIDTVGGKDNIVNASRCATRLRLELSEVPQGAKEKISAMPSVVTVVEKGGQLQIVVGTRVGEVFEVLSKELDLDENQETKPKSKQSILNRVIATMSAVFAPFVFILAAAGLIQGCLIIITQFAPDFSATGTYQVMSFISWTPFTFLPVLISVTASKHFKCNTFTAMACCLALVNPTFTEIASKIKDGESIKFIIFGLSETTYTSTVLPALFLVMILAHLERFLLKVLPDVIKSLFVPFICMVIIVPITLLVIGPISEGLADAMAVGYNFLDNNVPIVAGVIVGAFWQVIVIFGVHWGITPMVIADFAHHGCDSFQAFQTCAVVAQVAATFAVFIKSKDKEFRKISLSAGITGLFGITEAAIYGVTLRLKKPFICGCIAGAIGAVFVALFKTMYYVYAGLPGLLTIVNAVSPDNPQSFVGMVLGVSASIVSAIVLVWFVGFNEHESTEKVGNVPQL